MPGEHDTTQRILQRCRDLGFALAGVAEAKPTEFEREVRAWVERGMHGEMSYLASYADLRIDPSEMLPEAKSVICVADRYAASPANCDDDSGLSPLRGRVARYARGNDYHKVMRKRLITLARELQSLFPGETFRACVDTAPVFEREHAQRAGVGAIGKNTMLIQRGVGSYLLLGEIITTLPLAASRPSNADPCGGCTRCIDACPTHAIAPGGRVLDATRCISYLTIEHRSVIDESLHEAMGGWIFGCDICQDVCPHNQPTQRTRAAPVNAAYDSRLPLDEGFDLLEVLGWDDAKRQAAMINSAMKRARLDMMKRNALIAGANAIVNKDATRECADSLISIMQRLAETKSESPVVRETAEASLRRCLPLHRNETSE